MNYIIGNNYDINDKRCKYLGTSIDGLLDFFVDIQNNIIKKNKVLIRQGKDVIVISSTGTSQAKLYQVSAGIFKIFEEGSYNRLIDAEIIESHPYVKSIENHTSVSQIIVDGINILYAINS